MKFTAGFFFALFSSACSERFVRGIAAGANAVGDTDPTISVACESETGELRIFKFVGFEEARWVLPEVKQEHVEPAGETEPSPVAVQ